jgi:hypothetical protein
MLRSLWFSLLVLICLSAPPALAAGKADLFADGAAPLQLTLTAPFPALVRAASGKPAPYPATLLAADGAGPAQSFKVELTARGHFRRTTGNCAFPPLLLKFDKAAVKGTLFHGQHKLKLVTYCRPGADYEQRILLEYLAYKLYNVMTPQSFRVRAAQVTYRAEDGRGEPLTRFGFLIEDANDVADRNDRDKLDALTHQVAASQLDRPAAARAALFEYMIGNLDWEFLAAPPGEECCHNIRLLAAHQATPTNASAVVPVPYDFDFSGLVDAPYAGPPDGIPIQRLTQRYYRGYCVTAGDIPAAVAEYQAHRAALTAVVTNDPRLTPAFRDKTLKFLAGFFATLDDPGRVSREFGHCR